MSQVTVVKGINQKDLARQLSARNLIFGSRYLDEGDIVSFNEDTILVRISSSDSLMSFVAKYYEAYLKEQTKDPKWLQDKIIDLSCVLTQGVESCLVIEGGSSEWVPKKSDFKIPLHFIGQLMCLEFCGYNVKDVFYRVRITDRKDEIHKVGSAVLFGMVYNDEFKNRLYHELSCVEIIIKKDIFCGQEASRDDVQKIISSFKNDVDKLKSAISVFLNMADVDFVTHDNNSRSLKIENAIHSICLVEKFSTSDTVDSICVHLSFSFSFLPFSTLQDDKIYYFDRQRAASEIANVVINFFKGLDRKFISL